MKRDKWLTVVAILWGMAGVVSAAPQLTAVVPARNDAASESFSFAVIGDSQPKGVFGQPEAFVKIIREINKSGADFAVHLGDKISGSSDGEIVRKQYAEYFMTANELKVFVRYTVGNHEITGMKANEDIHRELFGDLYYSFSRNNALFIVLDTECTGEAGSISGRQMLWLKERLDEGRDYKYIFVFLHRPLFSIEDSKRDHRHFISAEHRDELAELLGKYNVSAVFAGHEHIYHCGMHDGLLQIVSGGAGAPFHFYPEGSFHHYLLVEVTRENAVIRAVPVN